MYVTFGPQIFDLCLYLSSTLRRNLATVRLYNKT